MAGAGGAGGLFRAFASTQALSGLILLTAAVVAIALANSPWRDTYHAIWNTPIAVGPAAHPLVLTARAWVNDAVMALFFLLVGLEIKRELLVGELSSARLAALPLAAALGGVVAPALIFLALAPADAARGWAIPAATDIAFALGVLALAVPTAPIGLTVFLAALAIVDDMAAVLIIALAYTGGVQTWALAAAAGIFLALVGLNRWRVRALWPYLALGGGLWFAIHESGVHSTIAGVLLALTVPTTTRIDAEEFSRTARAHLDEFDKTETGDRLVITSKGQQEALHALDAATRDVVAPLQRLEHALHAVCAFGVVPVFALANAGVTLIGAQLDLGASTAIAVALALGKPVGITTAAWLACRAGLAALPPNVTWGMIHGASWIAGIGFTMSLFIAALAYGATPRFEAAQVGVLAGSACAATVGALLLRRTTR